MSEETAKTILSVARQYAEHGREIPPHVVDELEAISQCETLPAATRADAETILAIEAMA